MWWLVVLLFGLFLAAPTAVDMIARGKRLTSATLDGDGSVVETPQALADAASAAVGFPVSVEEYALARMVRSEAGSKGYEHKRALVNVARNDARERRWSLLFTLTVSSVATRSGRFGKQTSRRYSTVQDPYEGDLVAVRRALAEDDNTGGAVKFVHVGSFGVQEGTGSYDELVARWAREGLRPLKLVDDLVVFHRSGVA